MNSNELFGPTQLAYPATHLYGIHMKAFPKLKAEQVAILRAETSTGHVLDENFELATNDEQEVYTVCESLHDAVNLVTTIMKERADIECVIYGSNKHVLKYLSSSFRDK